MNTAPGSNTGRLVEPAWNSTAFVPLSTPPDWLVTVPALVNETAARPGAVTLPALTTVPLAPSMMMLLLMLPLA